MARSNDDWTLPVRKFVSDSLTPSASGDTPPSGTTADDAVHQVISLLTQIKSQPPTVQVGLGAVVGFTNGYFVKKLARMALLGLGGGMLVLSIAYAQGYLTVNRSNLRDDFSRWIKRTQTRIQTLRTNQTLSDDSLVLFYERWAPRVFNFISFHYLFLSGTSAGFLLSFAL